MVLPLDFVIRDNRKKKLDISFQFFNVSVRIRAFYFSFSWKDGTMLMLLMER